MSDTILTLGIVCVAAAIVGGGVSAAGVKVPVISSLLRQTALFAFGVILAAAAKWPDVRPTVFPPQSLSIQDGPRVLASDDFHKIPLTPERSGLIEVRMEALVPSSTQPRIIICPAEIRGECPWRQLSAADSYSVVLPVGSATITVFNYRENPQITYTLRVNYQVDAWYPAWWLIALLLVLASAVIVIVARNKRTLERDDPLDPLQRDVLRFMWNVHNGVIPFAQLQPIIGAHVNLVSIACHQLQKRGFLAYNPYVPDSLVQLLPDGREFAAGHHFTDARDILAKAAGRSSEASDPDYAITAVNAGEFGITALTSRAQARARGDHTVVFKGQDPALHAFVRAAEAEGFRISGKNRLAH